ncbi:MAG TPA: methyltransferase domain-containing protein [Conexibacter sp.]|nr:methyltransferase domain-containing protein [Conexibacter sp.]
MAAVDIATEISRFERWHYEFELDGHRTPVWDPGHRNRHRQRRSYVFDNLVRACGGSLRGRRVLDLGCNAGWWSLAAIEAGAERVVGVDGRRMHVEQAELVFSVKGVDPARYAFHEANLLAPDALPHEPFDVVLCLGLLYHVNRPYELMELMARAQAAVICIDTEVSQRPGSAFDVRFDDPENPKDAVDDAFVLVPTRRAVHDLVGQFGYDCATLAPRFDDWEACRDYRVGLRRAFLAARAGALDLSALVVETDGAGRRIRDTGRWALRSARAAVRGTPARGTTGA